MYLDKFFMHATRMIFSYIFITLYDGRERLRFHFLMKL